MEHWLEILFGGVGGSALLALLGWLFSRRRKTGSKALRITGTKSRNDVFTSPPYSADSTRDAVSTSLEPGRIARAIKNAAPFARPTIANNFIGLQVNWQLLVKQVLPSADGELVHVRLGENGDRFPYVLVDVATAKFPFLRFVHEESLMTVRGKVCKASEHELVLAEVDLELLEARLGD